MMYANRALDVETMTFYPLLFAIISQNLGKLDEKGQEEISHLSYCILCLILLWQLQHNSLELVVVLVAAQQFGACRGASCSTIVGACSCASFTTMVWSLLWCQLQYNSWSLSWCQLQHNTLELVVLIAAQYFGACPVSCSTILWSLSCQLQHNTLELVVLVAAQQFGACRVSCSTKLWSLSCQLQHNTLELVVLVAAQYSTVLAQLKNLPNEGVSIEMHHKYIICIYNGNSF